MKQSRFLLLFIFTALVSAAQKHPAITTGNPATAGFSVERLTRIDTAMNGWVNRGWTNGAVALVIRNNKVVYYHAAGYNDLSTKETLRKDAIFRIASQTKAITSVAIMMLVEEGNLLLTDPVSKYIPSFSKQQVLSTFNEKDSSYTTVPANREITIHDLLTHTSGVGYAQIGSKEATAIYAKNNITAGIGVRDRTLLDAMTQLGKLPLMHQPGEKWTYGLNTDILGCIVEIVSGMKLSDFFRKRIFEPLGMKDTYFNLPGEKGNRLVNLYYEDESGKLLLATKGLLNSKAGPEYPLEGSTYYSGGAGLVSTIYDYAVFLQMLLNGGEYNGARILSPSSVRLMTINQTGKVSFRPGDDFGYGFQVTTPADSGTPSQPGTFSWGGAFSTSYWVDPKQKMVLLLYRQMLGSKHGDVVNRFLAMTYGALTE